MCIRDSTITESLASGTTQAFYLKVIQGSTARQFSWSSFSHIKWSGGTGPNITAGAGTENAVDILSFITFDEGTTWYGKVLGQHF